MGNKVVELQIELQQTKLLMESICSRNGDLQKKKLAQEAIVLAKERDRMMHNAKAAAWKLQEVRLTMRIVIRLFVFPRPLNCLFSFTAPRRQQNVVEAVIRK
jgi:hypothetical protein